MKQQLTLLVHDDERTPMMTYRLLVALIAIAAVTLLAPS